MEKKMSKVDIMMQSIELRKAGKEAEAHELLRKKVPLEPWEFVYLKKCFGIQMVKQAGFDMSLIEAKYGQNWAVG
jgi:hypothetical protein